MLRGCISLAFLMLAAVATAVVPEGALQMRMVSAPALFPDGKSMVFEWCDDLWIASADGGEAKRIVNAPGRDAYPRVTPDGQRIVFSSDRSGSLQVYSIPVDGGEPIRHTHHTEGNELECLSPDGKRAIVRGEREHFGFLATRLMEVDLTKDLRERRLFDATGESAAWAPDGNRVLFCRGGEQLYRKGYHGARCSQIWLYQMDSGSFTRMSRGASEERSPLWLPDGSGFYFTSNRGGAANLWLQLEGQEARQLTHFPDDGVIKPDLSADGSTLVFRVAMDVYRLRPRQEREPVALELWTREPLPDVSIDKRRIEGTKDADFTPDGRQVVFSAAGDLWWIDHPGGEARRLTTTTASEEDVRFAPDGDWLFYLNDDGISANYHRVKFANGTLTGDQAVTHGTRSKCRIAISPDGARIAWIEGTGDVFTALADGTDPRRVFQCWDKPTLDWSPDGRWLALAAEDEDSNRDIWLVAADGSGKPVNLTDHPAFDGSPRWVPDGSGLMFVSRRGGGKPGLWKIDFPGNKPPRTKPHPKATAIPTKGIEPVRLVWARDSGRLWFQSSSASSQKLYSIRPDGKDMRVESNTRGVPIRFAANGDLLLRVNGTPEVLSKSGSIRFPIDLTAERPRKEVLRLGFLRVWRTLGERYYDEEMNGRDWDSMRAKYQTAAESARGSIQFDRVISLLRGELNASHLAFHRRLWPEEIRSAPHEDATAHPGLMFVDDHAPDDAPLRIAKVLDGSPVSRQPHPPKPGEIVVKVAGKPVFHRTPLHSILEGAADRSLPLVLRSPDGAERVVELRCISYQRARALDRMAEESNRGRLVTRTLPESTYQIVPDMSRSSLDRVSLEIHRARKAKGLVLDLRGNGGGREADRLLNVFCQPVHSHTVPRDGPTGYPIDRRTAPAWNKPLVVLCDQNTFSNAEIFCHAVQHIGRAPLVGTATAGGVISAVKTSIPDVGELQIPFRGWYEDGSGLNMDQHGAQPDHAVELTPADEDAGRDPQLDKALEVLQSLISGAAH